MSKLKTLKILRLFAIVISVTLLAIFLYPHISRIFAVTYTTVTLTSETDFSTGTFGSTTGYGSGDDGLVRLTGSAGPDGTENHRIITINNSSNSSELIDYQVKIVLDTASIISEGKMQSDCRDIRFKDSDDETQITNFWVGRCNTATTEIWVRVATIPALSTKEIYLYYNSDSATDIASGKNTFELFSDRRLGFISNSEAHTCAITSTGTVMCWGLNSTGQLGDGTLVNSATPVTVVGISGATSVAAGDKTSCASLSNGTVKCWGSGLAGRLGTGNVNNSYTPVTVLNISNAVSVEMTVSIACARLSDSTLKCWGNNAYGQMGNGSTASGVLSPIVAFQGQSVTDFTLEEQILCVLLADGSIKCAGLNNYGQLGNDTIINSSLPVTVTGISNAVSVQNGRYHTCAVLNTGIVKCWGYGYTGRLGNGLDNSLTYKTPISMLNATSISMFSTGQEHNLALFTDGTLKSVGSNYGGALGLNFDNSYRTSLNTVPGLSDLVFVYTGRSVSYALKSNGDLYTWGWNLYSQLGIGGTANQLTPALVSAYNLGGKYGVEGGRSEIRKAGDHSFVYKRTTIDPTTSVGLERPNMMSVGTWESATDALDLKWNGGWGNGTDGSTAFSSVISNVGAGANIAFSIRSASTEELLNSAVYQVLGVANSGIEFSVTKADIDALGIPTGVLGRYVQVKATFNSVDLVTNPELLGISINYLSDNTAPETTLSDIKMRRTAGGDLIIENEWTNLPSPFFSWTEADDSQSTILGYCLYLGADPDGDPETSKGLLGVSPHEITTEDCQFIVTSPSIDFADESLSGSTWLSLSLNSYYLNIKAIDKANNISNISQQFVFNYDDAPPTPPAYVSLPGGFISNKATTIYWPTSGVDQAIDLHSGISGLQYRIHSDGIWYGAEHTGTQDFTDVLSNSGDYTFVTNPDFANIDEGNNMVFIRSIDNAGNISSSYASGTIKINTISASSPLNLSVTPSINTTNAFAFDWDPPATYTGLLANITYCYTINTLPSVQTCNFTQPGVTNLEEDAYANQPGQNTMYVVAKDEAGNINYDTYEQIEFTANTSEPGIALGFDIVDVSVKATSTWKIALSWEEPASVGSGVSYYDIKHSTNGIDFASEATTTSNSYFDINLIQRIHYYKIRACDSANNCGAYTSTISIYPDGKFTSAALLVSQPTASQITTKSTVISWVTDRASDSKIQFGLKSGEYFKEEIGNSTQLTDHVLTINSLNAETIYYYVARWTDEDGNTGVSEEKVFTTAPAPVVSNVVPSNIGLNSAVISFTVKSAYKASIVYGPTLAYGSISELSTSPLETRYSAQLTGLLDGIEYHYAFVLEDSEGYEYPILQDNSFSTPPRPTITNVQIQEVKGSAQSTMNVTWQSNTEISSIVTFSPISNPAFDQDVINLELIAGEHMAEITGLIPTTTYKLQIKGIDAFNNSAISDEFVFTTLTDTRPPKISNVQVIGLILSSEVQADRTKSAQLIVSWDTDEPASSQVEFGEGTGEVYTQRTAQDGNNYYNHVVVISNLSPSNVYHLRALSGDFANNFGQSNNNISITPKATNSVIELVFGSLAKSFDFLR